jgi:hypothetical protein
MTAIYSNGGNRWNILGINFTKGDVLSSLYKIFMTIPCWLDLLTESVYNFIIVNVNDFPAIARSHFASIDSIKYKI